MYFNTKSLWISAVIVLCAGALNVNLVRAQATATILGTVMDPSGAAIGGAVVQLKNTGTGITQNAISDEQGRYRFPELAIGEYERSEEHTSELQSRFDLVCRLLLEK